MKKFSLWILFSFLISSFVFSCSDSKKSPIKGMADAGYNKQKTHLAIDDSFLTNRDDTDYSSDDKNIFVNSNDHSDNVNTRDDDVDSQLHAQDPLVVFEDEDHFEDDANIHFDDLLIEDDNLDNDNNDDSSDDSITNITSTQPWLVQTKYLSKKYIRDSKNCLQEDVSVNSGKQFEAYGFNQFWVKISLSEEFLKLSDVQVLQGPFHNVEGYQAIDGITGIETKSYTLDISGCINAGNTVAEATPIKHFGEFHDVNYHGYIQTGSDLSYTPVRHAMFDTYTPPRPWRSVGLISKVVTSGWVVGGAVLITPSTMITAAHINVDSSFCYSFEPRYGVTYSEHRETCNNIKEVIKHPTVDLAIVKLIAPETTIPIATVASQNVSVGDEFYVVRTSNINQHSIVDGKVDELNNQNYDCGNGDWPSQSSIIYKGEIVGGGDSGSAVFKGDQVIGLVHGERNCFACVICPWKEGYRQIFVHLAPFYTWIEQNK